MEGGHVYGREAVRRYWTHQWSLVDPHVEPLSFTPQTDGSIIAEVHQTVRNLTGQILLDQAVGHIFQIRDGNVVRFDIRGRCQSVVQRSQRASDVRNRPIAAVRRRSRPSLSACSGFPECRAPARGRPVRPLCEPPT